MNFLFSRNLLAPKKGSLIAGYLYWPVYLLLLSLLLVWLLPLIGVDLSRDEGYLTLNLVYFTVNFIAVLLIFRPFLWQSFQAAKGNWGRIFLSVPLAYALCYVLSVQIQFLYTVLDLIPENLNQESVTDYLNIAPVQMAVATVLFAPVTEECLVRGLLFAPLAKKVPVLGYLLSIVVFAGIHVVGSIGQVDGLTLLLCFLEYVPHSIALAWAYHRSGNILSSIVLHMAINLMAVIAQFQGVM